MQVCPDLGQFVSLRRLLPEAEIPGAGDIAISGCACDSRQVREGELFAALVGSRHDGHDFIAEAVARGCAAVLERPPADRSGRAVVHGAQRAGGLRPAVPNAGRKSQPTIEIDRRYGHQRQNDHELLDRRHADGGRLSRRRAGDPGISRWPDRRAGHATRLRRPSGWRNCWPAWWPTSAPTR